MFIYYFSRIDLPYELVATPFRRAASELIKKAILEDNEADPRILCGPALEREGAMTVPIRVMAGSWFRRLDADIELARVGSGVCQLTLSGSYEPALGASYDRGDGRAGHRLTEGFVRELIENLSARLVAMEASSGR